VFSKNIIKIDKENIMLYSYSSTPIIFLNPAFSLVTKHLYKKEHKS